MKSIEIKIEIEIILYITGHYILTYVNAQDGTVTIVVDN
jgi:hypothetical protein